MANTETSDSLGHWQVPPALSHIKPKQTHGFVYCIESLKTGHLYLGRKQTVHGGKKSSKLYGKETPWRTYRGSSKNLKALMIKEGAESFLFHILEYFYTRGGLNAAEIEWQVKCDCLTAKMEGTEDRLFLNGQIAAMRWVPKEFHTDETRRKMRESHAKNIDHGNWHVGKPARNPKNRDNLVPGGLDPKYWGPNKKAVIVTKGEEQHIFNDSKSAARFIGCAHDSVARVCRGEKKTIYGWRATWHE
jgi:hypothetical protein